MRGFFRAGEMRLDLVGEIMDVDDRLFEAGLGEPVEHMVDQGFAADGDERLGDRVR